MSYEKKQPPQTCRLHVHGYALENGAEVDMTDNLIWRGVIWFRGSDSNDALYKLEHKNSFVWVQRGDFEFITEGVE
jgi:hypothetical protein